MRRATGIGQDAMALRCPRLLPGMAVPSQQRTPTTKWLPHSPQQSSGAAAPRLRLDSTCRRSDFQTNDELTTSFDFSLVNFSFLLVEWQQKTRQVDICSFPTGKRTKKKYGKNRNTQKSKFCDLGTGNDKGIRRKQTNYFFGCLRRELLSVCLETYREHSNTTFITEREIRRPGKGKQNTSPFAVSQKQTRSPSVRREQRRAALPDRQIASERRRDLLRLRRIVESSSCLLLLQSSLSDEMANVGCFWPTTDSFISSVIV